MVGRRKITPPFEFCEVSYEKHPYKVFSNREEALTWFDDEMKKFLVKSVMQRLASYNRNEFSTVLTINLGDPLHCLPWSAIERTLADHLFTQIGIAGHPTLEQEVQKSITYLNTKPVDKIDLVLFKMHVNYAFLMLGGMETKVFFPGEAYEPRKLVEYINER